MGQNTPTPRIAVDAMGGDDAPRAVVRGAARAATQWDVHVTLVGRTADLERELAELPEEHAGACTSLSIVNARDVIEMDEHPAQAVRTKKDSSIVRACELVATNECEAIVSAGNSGAVLAAALFSMTRLPGVSRPAIGGTFPRAHGTTFVLDIGANVDCKPEWLAQFAMMGHVYAKTMLNVPSPKVGLLSNGEESTKGSEMVQAAHALCAELPITFVGNVEGSDLFSDRCDVIVTDGFTGNVALKTAEGTGEFLFAAMKQAAEASTRGRFGGALLKPTLRALRDRLDYRTSGGALLLGVSGEVIIAHGKSDEIAVANAIRLAMTAAQRDVSGAIAHSMTTIPQSTHQPARAQATTA